IGYLGRLAMSRVGTKGFVPVLYLIVCLLFYSTMFYIVAPIDRFLQNPATGVQMLILIAVMNSLFHNIQYHAIVWHYGQSRYNSNESTFGPAKWINGKTSHYLAVGLALGLVFGFIGWNVGDWPGFDGHPNPAPYAIAYILFLGIIGHHFYLDQRIW